MTDRALCGQGLGTKLQGGMTTCTLVSHSQTFKIVYMQCVHVRVLQLLAIVHYSVSLLMT